MSVLIAPPFQIYIAYKRIEPLLHSSVFNDIPPHEPPLQASSSPIPKIRIWPIIIHQTHYEKSDWSRAFNQFTIACELDMINAISAADIAFIMSSSTSAWLLSPLECFPQKQNG